MQRRAVAAFLLLRMLNQRIGGSWWSNGKLLITVGVSTAGAVEISSSISASGFMSLNSGIYSSSQFRMESTVTVCNIDGHEHQGRSPQRQQSRVFVVIVSNIGSTLTGKTRLGHIAGAKAERADVLFSRVFLWGWGCQGRGTQEGRTRRSCSVTA
jgi:hypothetical protein